MKCIHHSDAEAVGSCAKCGAGLCQQCFSSSAYTWDSKPMCHNCNLATMNDLLANSRSDVRSYLIRIIINGIFLAIGVGAWLATKSAFGYFAWAGIGAVPTLLKAMKPDLSEQVQCGVERAHGDFTMTLLGPIIRLALSFIFGGIASPFIVLFGVFKFLKAKKRVSQYSAEIEAYRAA